MRALLLAGGRGTRLLPYTAVLPKPLVPVGELPVMEILLRQLVQHGIDDVVVSVGYLAGLLEAYFGDGSRLGARLRYLHESEPLGTAGPVRLLADLDPDEALLVLNGDLLTDLDFGAFVARYATAAPAIQVGTCRRIEQIDLGVLDVNAAGDVAAYREKPSHIYTVSMGVYIVSRQARDLIPAAGRFDMPDLVTATLARRLRVTAFAHEGMWLDIGRLDDHRRATEMAASHPELFQQADRSAVKR